MFAPLLAGVCAALYLITLMMFVILHRLDRTVDIRRDPVSLYARGTHAAFFRVYGYIGTLAALLLTVQLYRAVAPLFPPRVIVSMVLLIAFRLGVVWIPTDAKHARTSTAGRLHLLLAVATFSATYTAIAAATPVFADKLLPLLVLYLNVMRYVAMFALGAVVITMLPVLQSFFGVSERLFLLATQLWFLGCSLWFLLAVF